MRRATPLLPLLKVTFESIFEVFLLCIAGYILARKGVLDRPTQKQLNRLNVSLFTPALLFSKVAFFLSPAKLQELWIIPIFFTVVTLVSSVVAYILGWTFRLKSSQRNFAIAAAMFMNSNSLPIALMQSLVTTVPDLKWDESDNKNAMVGRALTYLVLYSTLGMVLRWSYGVRLLSMADPESVPEGEAGGVESPLLDQDETAFPPSATEHRVLRRDPSTESTTDVETPSIVIESADDPRRAGPKSKVFYSFPNSPSRTQTSLPQSSSALVTPDDSDDDETLDFPTFRQRRFTEPTSSKMQSFLRQLKRKTLKFLRTVNDFMTVPLWAALASLIVACIPPLQHTLEVHVTPIKKALNMAGNVSIPLTLVVLGAYFYTPPDADAKSLNRSLPSHLSPEPEEPERGRSLPSKMSQLSLVDSVRGMFRLNKLNGSAPTAAHKNEKRPGETKTVLIAILSRMIITPIILLPMMALSTKFNLQEIFSDPVFVVSNVLLVASPPALTLAQITQAASGDAFERLISRTIFWSYCIVTPPATIAFVVIGLVLSKL